VETGSNATACATTQFALFLIPETLLEKPALARPIRRVVLAVRSLQAGDAEFGARSQAGKILFLAQCRKNPVPGAVLASEESAYDASPSLAYCSDHSAGASRRLAMPTPRGRRPSTAACTKFGARNASEIVILT
jgi:hypothetical protein